LLHVLAKGVEQPDDAFRATEILSLGDGFAIGRRREGTGATIIDLLPWIAKIANDRKPVTGADKIQPCDDPLERVLGLVDEDVREAQPCDAPERSIFLKEIACDFDDVVMTQLSVCIVSEPGVCILEARNDSSAANSCSNRSALARASCAVRLAPPLSFSRSFAIRAGNRCSRSASRISDWKRPIWSHTKLCKVDTK